MNQYKCYGAILGDIVGSIYELNPIKSRDFEFFDEKSHWTDDTIMTLASCSKLLNDSSYALEYKWWGNKYYGDYYGKNFKEWIKREDFTSNDSYGNGSAMRVSPIGYVKSWPYTAVEAYESAKCSHDNQEAIKAAVFIADSVRWLKNGLGKEYVERQAIEVYGRLLPKACVPFDKFKVRCDDTVPVAIRCFLQTTNLEDTIRLAVSLGGDCDTIASIAAELRVAFDGGIEEKYVTFVHSKLDIFQLATLVDFNIKFLD